MKKIVCISGSARKNSSTIRLLTQLHQLNSNCSFVLSEIHFDLPLFTADFTTKNVTVEDWEALVDSCDGVIIASPEYIYNIPAVLKNAMEWLTAKGTFANKPTLPIIYTPNAPRGEKALQSLLWSLMALDAKILSSLLIHYDTVRLDSNNNFDGDELELLKEALNLF